MRLRHALNCNGVAFSPVGDLLASGGRERVIRFWDPATGKELRQLLGPDQGVAAVAFSPDGKLLAGAGRDAIVYLWDAVTGKEVRRLEGHKREAVALAFSAKGDVLAVGDTMDIRLWDVAGGKLLQTLHGTVGLVESVALSPDGRTVAGAGMGIWATDTGKLVHEAPAKNPYAGAVVFSKDGKYLITVGQEATVVWETATGKKVDRLTGAGNRRPCAALSPDGQLLAIGGEDGVVRLWDWAAAKEVRQICRLALPVHTVAFSRDGKTLACGGNWGTIRLWDVATGKPKETVPGHQEGLTSVVYAPGAARIATTGWDGTVRLWERAHRQGRAAPGDSAKGARSDRHSDRRFPGRCRGANVGTRRPVAGRQTRRGRALGPCRHGLGRDYRQRGDPVRSQPPGVFPGQQADRRARVRRQRQRGQPGHHPPVRSRHG